MMIYRDYDGKDAVECRLFAQPNHWFLPVQAQLSDALWQSFIDCIEKS